MRAGEPRVGRECSHHRPEIEEPVGDVQHEHPAGFQSRQIERHGLAGEQMRGDRIRGERVEYQDVIDRRAVLHERQPRVPGNHAIVRLPSRQEIEVLRIPRDLRHSRVDLEEGPRLARHAVIQERSDTKTDHGDAAARVRGSERPEHVARGALRAVVRERSRVDRVRQRLAPMHGHAMSEPPEAVTVVAQDTVYAEEIPLGVLHDAELRRISRARDDHRGQSCAETKWATRKTETHDCRHRQQEPGWKRQYDARAREHEGHRQSHQSQHDRPREIGPRRAWPDAATPRPRGEHHDHRGEGERVLENAGEQHRADERVERSPQRPSNRGPEIKLGETLRVRTIRGEAHMTHQRRAGKEDQMRQHDGGALAPRERNDEVGDGERDEAADGRGGRTSRERTREQRVQRGRERPRGGERKDESAQVQRQWQNPEERDRRDLRGDVGGHPEHEARGDRGQRDPAKPSPHGDALHCHGCLDRRIRGRHARLAPEQNHRADREQRQRGHIADSPRPALRRHRQVALEDHRKKQQSGRATEVAGRVEEVRVVGAPCVGAAEPQLQKRTIRRDHHERQPHPREQHEQQPGERRVIRWREERSWDGERQHRQRDNGDREVQRGVSSQAKAIGGVCPRIPGQQRGLVEQQARIPHGGGTAEQGQDDLAEERLEPEEQPGAEKNCGREEGGHVFLEDRAGGDRRQ